MIFAALTEAADRGELLLADGGMLRFRRLKDGSLTIRELLVLPTRRRQGLGRLLVDRLRTSARGIVRARCPLASPANTFWQAIGFRCAETVRSGGTEVNVWEWHP